MLVNFELQHFTRYWRRGGIIVRHGHFQDVCLPRKLCFFAPPPPNNGFYRLLFIVCTSNRHKLMGFWTLILNHRCTLQWPSSLHIYIATTLRLLGRERGKPAHLAIFNTNLGLWWKQVWKICAEEILEIWGSQHYTNREQRIQGLSRIFFVVLSNFLYLDHRVFICNEVCIWSRNMCLGYYVVHTVTGMVLDLMNLKLDTNILLCQLSWCRKPVLLSLEMVCMGSLSLRVVCIGFRYKVRTI